MAHVSLFLPSERQAQLRLLERRSISELEGAAKLFEPRGRRRLSAVTGALARGIIDGGAYLAVIMGITRGGVETLFSESSN